MKNKHLKLILAMPIAVALFLRQDAGINLCIFGLILAFLSLLPITVEKIKRCIWELLMYVVSLLSFAWYGDEISFMASWCSFFLLQLRLHYADTYLFPGIVVVILNFITTPVRVWFFKKWLVMKDLKKNVKNTLYLGLIPGIILLCFVGIYALANEDLANFLQKIHIHTDVFNSFWIMVLVFVVLFNAWYLMFPPKFSEINSYFSDEIANRSSKLQHNTAYFLKSGLVSFISLSVLLLVLIALQVHQLIHFAQVGDLSHQIHKSVTALIISLLMAVGVILIYFNAKIAESPLKKQMKVAAYIWILLNVILVLLAFFQNTQYVQAFGLTFQRIGVYVFLLLSTIGLYLGLIKIRQELSNAYVVNRMFRLALWCLVLSAPINFSQLVTHFNLSNTKKVDVEYLKTLEFNTEMLDTYLKANVDSEKYQDWKKWKGESVKMKKDESFLSSKIYYKLLKF